VSRNEARTVEAKQDCLRLFREDLAGQIGADQEDGDFFGDASASAHNLQWQREGHNETAGRPIKYLRLALKSSVFSQRRFASDDRSNCEAKTVSD
jgi:hypothetical protein